MVGGAYCKAVPLKTLENDMNSELSNKLKQYLEQKHPCIVCGSEDFSNWASEDYLNALRCNQCGMISINPHFTEEGLNEFYSNYYQNRAQDAELRILRRNAYKLDRDWISHFVSRGKVLDIGCSDGSFLSFFDAEKWDRYGIDLTEDALQVAATKHGVKTFIGKVWESDVGGDYDLVMMRGVIEHFRDPIPVLDKCMQILKPGGLLFITATPAGDSFAFSTYREKWRMFTPYEHIHFFTVKLLTSLVEVRGGEYVSHHYQYEETPYAKVEIDFRKISDDIVAIARDGDRRSINASPPFPGSMLTAVWRKC
jgi:2-polyprenyl-3-methyl-5-hydroxy-6-metoxy-1,4-benzoquinol methylase